MTQAGFPSLTLPTPLFCTSVALRPPNMRIAFHSHSRSESTRGSSSYHEGVSILELPIFPYASNKLAARGGRRFHRFFMGLPGPSELMKTALRGKSVHLSWVHGFHGFFGEILRLQGGLSVLTSWQPEEAGWLQADMFDAAAKQRCLAERARQPSKD